jgi:hypothetical protein
MHGHHLAIVILAVVCFYGFLIAFACGKEK